MQIFLMLSHEYVVQPDDRYLKMFSG